MNKDKSTPTVILMRPNDDGTSNEHQVYPIVHANAVVGLREFIEKIVKENK